jgi:hypothetical protein
VGMFLSQLAGGATMTVTETDLSFCYSTLKSWVDWILELSERLKQNEYEMFAFSFNAFPRISEEAIRRLREVFEQTETYRLAVPTTFPPDFCGHKAACWSDAVAFVTLAQLPHEVSSSIPELQDHVSRSLAEDRDNGGVERPADIQLLFRLFRALMPPWSRWNRGAKKPTYVELTERSVLSIRDRMCPTLVMIRLQYALAVIALEREHAHVLIEMRRDQILRGNQHGHNRLSRDRPTGEYISAAVREQMRQLCERHSRVTKREVMDELGVGNDKALRLIEIAESEGWRHPGRGRRE